MTFWEESRKQIREKNIATDTTMTAYKKIASSGVNMLCIIKPSFYMGLILDLSYNYMSYVEKFLTCQDRDWGEYLKFILYIREISKRLLVNIQNIQGPLEQLVSAVEEIFEGEKYGTEDELEEEPEPEEVEDLESFSIDQIMEEKKEEMEEQEQGKSEELEESKITREELASDYEALKEELRVKLTHAEVPERVIEELSREIAEVYLECIQLRREITRLSKYPEGDLATLMSILLDIQYGLCHEMKRHLMEDIFIEERFQFNPGLLTWSAHFLANLSEKINIEWKVEETSGS